MICLLESIALESLGNLGIALAISLTSHSKILAYLAALAVEVCTQVVNHLLANTLGLAVANAMNSSIGGLTLVLQLRELRSRSLTDGALLRSSIAFIDISTNGADKLFLHNRCIRLVINK
jgi:hypothetical protein